jgi:sarcosine oxidase
MNYDTIVVGLGAVGSATVETLAARGRRVLGLDRYTPPHVYGSTHGNSRIIRLAYMEDPVYVPLLHRAYALWAEKERETGRSLLRTTGGLTLGAPDSDAVTGCLQSVEDHDLPHEVLDAAELRRRYPPLSPDPDCVAILDPSAGALDPELCVSTLLESAQAKGAECRFETEVRGWDADGSGVAVRTDAGEFRAGRLVLAPGPWFAGLSQGGPTMTPTEVTREVMHWFEPAGPIEPFMPDSFPVYIWEQRSGETFYGFPALEGPTGGVKAAIHNGGESVQPDDVARDVNDNDIERMRAHLEASIPALSGRWLRGAVCLYTVTPDHNFILGAHPDAARVVVAGGLSGHGFKFASVLGEIVADLADEVEPGLQIGPFAPIRFS